MYSCADVYLRKPTVLIIGKLIMHNYRHIDVCAVNQKMFGVEIFTGGMVRKKLINIFLLLSK